MAICTRHSFLHIYKVRLAIYIFERMLTLLATASFGLGRLFQSSLPGDPRISI